MVATLIREEMELAELSDKLDSVLDAVSAVKVDVGVLIERTKGQNEAITLLSAKHREDVVDLNSRLTMVEAWRWKLVGVGTAMGGGIGAFSAWLVNQILNQK